MAYSLLDMIADVEREFPSLGWLLRDTDEGTDRANVGGGKYYAHIYNRGFHLEESHEGTGSTPEEAFGRALDKARAFRGSARPTEGER